jgi:hypothetical protein
MKASCVGVSVDIGRPSLACPLSNLQVFDDRLLAAFPRHLFVDRASDEYPAWIGRRTLLP